MNTNIDLLQIKIDEARKNLTKESKEAIDAVDWRNIIINMRAEKGYSFTQIEDLETETELLLCGLTSPEDYPKELEKRMGLPKARIDELVNEMNSRVFQRIHEELVKNINKTKGETSPLAPLLNKERGWGEVSSSPDKGRQEGLGIETREELLNKIENPNSITNDELRITNLEKEKKNTPSILEQKLSGAFQIPKIETDHTLENITKDNNTVGDKTKLPQIDPYRELPE